MAFNEFYIIKSGGGANNAAGSTTGAVSVAQTGGSWDITADTFIATGGTPFSAVNVGDWASIYVDGVTVTTYIAQVVTINSLGLSITLSTTAKYGTKPTPSTITRSCKIGGCHVSELPWASGGLTGTVPASTRVNWKQDSYQVIASRTFSLAGATTTPLWFRGYNTNPGDCDSNPALARPTLTLDATFTITASGADQIWSSVNASGNRTGIIWNLNGANGRLVRVRVENTSSNVGAIAFANNGATTVCAYCWFKSPSTATTTGVASIIGGTYIGVVFDTGGAACISSASTAGTFHGCITLNGVTGLLATTASHRVIGCTFYNPSGDGINWSSTPTAMAFVIGSLFSNCGGYGINNASGTNTDNVFRACNDYFVSGGSGTENGFGDVPSFFDQSEGLSPFVNAPTDLTLTAAALARQASYAPGGVENETYTSYLSIGAVQPASGRTGVLVNSGAMVG